MRLRAFSPTILALTMVCGLNNGVQAAPVDDFTVTTTGVLASPFSTSNAIVSNTFLGQSGGGYDSTGNHIIGGYRNVIVSNQGTGGSYTTFAAASGTATLTTSAGTATGSSANNFIALIYNGNNSVVTNPGGGGLNANLSGHLGFTVNYGNNQQTANVTAELVLTDTSGKQETVNATGTTGGNSLLSSSGTLQFAFSGLSSTPGFNMSSIASIELLFSFNGVDTFQLSVGGGGIIPFDGPGTSPEPISLATFGFLGLVGGVVARRKLKAKAAPVA